MALTPPRKITDRIRTRIFYEVGRLPNGSEVRDFDAESYNELSSAQSSRLPSQ